LQGEGSDADPEPGVDGAAGDGPTTDAGVAADAAPASPCSAQELLGPNGRCYFFEATLLSWSAARAACQDRGPGWDYVSILSAADAQFLGETLPFEAWIGASDLASEGTWTWAVDDRAFWVGGQDGAVVGGAYANWNSTEPNGATTTNCARALPSSFGSPIPDAPWADLDCAQLRGAICEAYPLN
jgi:lectin-like protein